jgi:hypothetical protein
MRFDSEISGLRIDKDNNSRKLTNHPTTHQNTAELPKVTKHSTTHQTTYPNKLQTLQN